MNENHTHQAAGTPTPVDGYIRDLIADIQKPAPQLQWEEFFPADAKTKPQYRLLDADGNTVTLTCDIDEETYCQHTLRVVDEEGRPVMHSTEWRTAGHTSELGTLYAMVASRLQSDEPEKVKPASKYATPEQTDCFIRALLRDAQMERPLLSWKKEYHDDKVRYYSSGLKKSGSSIWLQQDYVDEDSDSYTLQYVRDDEMLLSCTETAKRAENPDCLLRELFRLVAKNDLAADNVEISLPEVNSFVAETEMRKMLERIHGQDEGGPVLVGDLFRQATLHCITHQFVLAAIDKSPGLRTNNLERQRLQRLAEHTIGAIRCTKRNPNGATFTMRATSIAFDSPGMASRIARMTSSPQRISNAYITWGTEVFADAKLPRQARINRTCVLVLMAILKDELP